MRYICPNCHTPARVPFGFGLNDGTDHARESLVQCLSCLNSYQAHFWKPEELEPQKITTVIMEGMPRVIAALQRIAAALERAPTPEPHEVRSTRAQGINADLTANELRMLAGAVRYWLKHTAGRATAPETALLDRLDRLIAIAGRDADFDQDGEEEGE